MNGRRVIKLGGSALTNPHMPRQLNEWLQQQPPAENFLVVGGGNCIEAMRELDTVHGLDSVAMHWRCIRLLDATWEIVSELLPDWRPIATACELGQHLTAEPSHRAQWLVRVSSFYDQTHLHSKDASLPCDWRTTTDALAAYLAKISNADELVLLKMCSVELTDPQQLAKAGIVDPVFPQVVPDGIVLRVIQLGNAQSAATR